MAPVVMVMHLAVGDIVWVCGVYNLCHTFIITKNGGPNPPCYAFAYGSPNFLLSASNLKRTILKRYWVEGLGATTSTSPFFYYNTIRFTISCNKLQ